MKLLTQFFNLIPLTLFTVSDGLKTEKKRVSSAHTSLNEISEPRSSDADAVPECTGPLSQLSVYLSF